MQTRTSKLISTVILALAVSACTTPIGPADEVTLTEAGAVRLNGEQARTHVTGKTEAWLHGGAYYLADGSLKVKWRRTYLRGSWEVSDDGKLCYELPRWGRRCHIYMDKNGAILMLDEGVSIGERKMYDGDNLTALGTYAAGSGRKR